MSDLTRTFWLNAVIGIYLTALLVLDDAHPVLKLCWLLGAVAAVFVCRMEWLSAHNRTSAWSVWRWRPRTRDAEVRGDQPLVSWWIEQFAVILLTNEALRANRRSDPLTADRLRTVVNAGGQWERNQRRKIEARKSAEKIKAHLTQAAEAGQRMSDHLDSAVVPSIIAFREATQYRNRLDRERRKGLVFVHNEANRVRKELGLPLASPRMTI